MPTSHRLLIVAMLLAASLLRPGNAPADVAASHPEVIVIANLAEFRDMIFVVYKDGEFAKGVRVDPTTAEYHDGGYLLPPELPRGKLAMLGVARALAEKAKDAPDPAWLKPSTPGVVRVTGTIHTLPVQRHSAVHRYRLDKTDSGLQVSLLNPDVLTPYPAENLSGPEPKWSTSYLWVIVAGGALVLMVVFWSLWRLNRRNPPAGTSAKVE